MPPPAQQTDEATGIPATPVLAPVGQTSGEPPSVVILTRDEEDNIADCLRALAFSDDIVILDSFSTDRTLKIAAAFPNVRIFQRPFDTEWKQRNYALHEIAYKHPWLYICDADERVPEDLAAEILRVINDPGRRQAAYRVRFKNMYMGQWIKRSSSYPVWIMRLVRPSRVSYEVRETNVHPIVDGAIGSLQSHFIHYSFNSGMERWFLKHNFYSSREALEGVKQRSRGWPSLMSLWSRDRMVRRRSLKNMSYFLGGRPIWRFLAGYILGGGFLDGHAGLSYALLMAMYEYWIELKIKERESHWRRSGDKCVKRRLAEDTPVVATTGQPPLVEVLIPTLNEADHIVEAVNNARRLGPVFVLDSCSKDGTQELARQCGATVVEHKFENYAAQKNWGLDNLPFRGQWILILDADERITPALKREILAIATDAASASGYYVNRLLISMGQLVRHGGLYPSWNLRFWRRGQARYEDRSVHEHVVCNGRTDYLKGELLHIRRESMSRLIEKHIRYADMESQELLKAGRHGSAAKPEQLFKNDLRLHQWLRRILWPMLPMRFIWRPFYMYIVRVGFLDGRAGWQSAMLMGNYEMMIALLLRQKRLREAAVNQHSNTR